MSDGDYKLPPRYTLGGHQLRGLNSFARQEMKRMRNEIEMPTIDGVAPSNDDTTIAVGTIDLTPSWRGVAQLLIAGIESGTPAARDIAIVEIMKMAETADAYVKIAKEKRL